MNLTQINSYTNVKTYASVHIGMSSDIIHRYCVKYLGSDHSFVAAMSGLFLKESLINCKHAYKFMAMNSKTE